MTRRRPHRQCKARPRGRDRPRPTSSTALARGHRDAGGERAGHPSSATCHVWYGSSGPCEVISRRSRPTGSRPSSAPPGCGKSTLLRCFNRMNDLVPGAQLRGPDPLPRRGSLRPGHRRGRGSPAHRHGLPEAQPVPQVDLRQRRLRARVERLQGRSRRRSSRPACAAPRSGTRSRTSSSSPAWPSPAASSSGSASRAPSPSSRRSSSWTSRARPWTRWPRSRSRS